MHFRTVRVENDIQEQWFVVGYGICGRGVGSVYAGEEVGGWVSGYVRALP